MNRSIFARGRQQRAALAEAPRPRHHKYRRWDAGDGGENSAPDRLTCSVCAFPGIAITAIPGGGFPTAQVVTGTTYVWTSPSESVTTLDKRVAPTPQPGISCAFCGATRFLDGQKGSGNAIP